MVSNVHRLSEADGGTLMPWYTITDGFDLDLGVDNSMARTPIRESDSVFRTHFINNRGDEAVGSTWSYLDMTALARQDTWEDSPQGYRRRKPYARWNWHDP